MKQKRLKPHHYIPKFSMILLKALRTPLLAYFAIGGNVITFASAYFFYVFEEGVNETVQSYWDAAWWAICTVSTVGYGDIVPTTTGGRLVAFFLIIAGVTFFLGAGAVLVSIMSTIANEDMKDHST